MSEEYEEPPRVTKIGRFRDDKDPPGFPPKRPEFDMIPMNDRGGLLPVPMPDMLPPQEEVTWGIFTEDGSTIYYTPDQFPVPDEELPEELTPLPDIPEPPLARNNLTEWLAGEIMQTVRIVDNRRRERVHMRTLLPLDGPLRDMDAEGTIERGRAHVSNVRVETVAHFERLPEPDNEEEKEG